MRTVLLLLAAGLLWGCSAPGSGNGGAHGRALTGPAASSESAADPPDAGGRLDERVEGKVVEFNPALRFVIMDFPLNRMPALEQRLGIYREGRKVGEVRVSGPVRDTTIAGDVMTGSAQAGDEVREN